MIQHGLVVEDNSSNNALNYREMTSKDGIGEVYREHMPRKYNLVLAAIRAHNAQEKMRKIEREGGKELEEATPSSIKTASYYHQRHRLWRKCCVRTTVICSP
jgi:hypothetical protein